MYMFVSRSAKGCLLLCWLALAFEHQAKHHRTAVFVGGAAMALGWELSMDFSASIQYDLWPWVIPPPRTLPES